MQGGRDLGHHPAHEGYEIRLGHHLEDVRESGKVAEVSQGGVAAVRSRSFISS